MKTLRIAPILIVLVMVSGLMSGQASINDLNLDVVYVNTPLGQVRAQIRGSEKQIRTKEEYRYEWHSRSAIHSSMGSYSGKLLHGRYVAYFPNGDLREEGNYKRGMRRGQWYQWYQGGGYKSVCRYRKGRRHGKCETFDKQGVLTGVEHYRRGKQKEDKEHTDSTGKSTSLVEYEKQPTDGLNYNQSTQGQIQSPIRTAQRQWRPRQESWARLLLG